MVSTATVQAPMTVQERRFIHHRHLSVDSTLQLILIHRPPTGSCLELTGMCLQEWISFQGNLLNFYFRLSDPNSGLV